MLDERNTRLLREAVVAIGAKASKRLLRRVVSTQRAGGLRTADGSRKRTPGGVFFHLLRDEMDADAYPRPRRNHPVFWPSPRKVHVAAAAAPATRLC